MTDDNKEEVSRSDIAIICYVKCSDLTGTVNKLDFCLLSAAPFKSHVGGE